MTVGKIKTEEQELNIKDITLLTIEEAFALPDDLLYIGRIWWLQSHGGTCWDAAYVNYMGFISDKGSSVDTNWEVRPALVIDFDSSNFEVGDKFFLAGYPWTIISDRLALCDDTVGSSVFRYKHDVENKIDANNFILSDIRKWLYEWAKKKGIVLGVNK